MDPQSLAMLGAGGAPPDPGFGQPTGDPLGGASPAAQAADPTSQGDMSPEEILQSMLQLATLYRNVESDHGDVLKIEKASTLIQQILADHQAQHDQLMGGNFSTMRRLAGG